MTSPSKPAVYLLGPMTGYLDRNFPAFNRWAKFLRGEGFTVFNPAEFEEVLGGHEVYAEYILRDTPYLMQADAGVAMPGWYTSKGATWEAYTLGVMYDRPVYNVKDMTLIPPDTIKQSLVDYIYRA